MSRIAVTLLAKPGCHLCDDARVVVGTVADEVRERGVQVDFSEFSILDDPALEQRYAEDIPVVFVGDELHAQWRVDPDAFQEALLDAAR